jgi:hypothetical protein
MKYTQKQLEEMSDFEINKLLAKKDLVGILNLDRATKNAVEIIFANGQISIKDYCNSWADMGPIAHKNNISIMSPRVSNLFKNHWEVEAKGVQPNQVHINPLRAAAIVYLLME